MQCRGLQSEAGGVGVLSVELDGFRLIERCGGTGVRTEEQQERGLVQGAQRG